MNRPPGLCAYDIPLPFIVLVGLSGISRRERARGRIGRGGLTSDEAVLRGIVQLLPTFLGDISARLGARNW